MTTVKHENIIFHNEQLDAAARFLSKQKGMSFREAKESIISLATHHMTPDTYWRQGLWFIYVVYHGKENKIAEICIDAQKVHSL